MTGRPTRIRSDGWTVQCQLRFLEILRATRSVSAAARAAGMSRESAHRLRARDPHGLFAAMWDGACLPPRTAVTRAEIDQRRRRALALACAPLANRASRGGVDRQHRDP